MAKMIKVVVKEPGKMSEVVEIEKSLESYQKTVGGWLQAIPLFNLETHQFDNRYSLVLNEEGKLEGLQPNIRIPGDFIVGTFFVAKVKGDDWTSLEHDEAYRIAAMVDLLKI